MLRSEFAGFIESLSLKFHATWVLFDNTKGLKFQTFEKFKLFDE